jgi:hypothetical protein
MDSKSECELPSYLLPLLEPRPSGEAKLLAAWDGLSVERQILLLEHLVTHGHLGWTNRVRSKVLTSPNAYVRYLAARGFRPSDGNGEEVALKERIDADPEPLVRYATREDDCLLRRPDELESGNAPVFFALPQEARLATVRSLPNKGEEIAAFIRHAVQNELPSGRVTEEELAHLLMEYVTNPHFQSHYRGECGYDGYFEYGKGKDIVALWMLVPDVPERISWALIRNLPEASGTSGIPAEILSRMTRPQLECLLERPDIHLKELRKKIFDDALHAKEEVPDWPDCLLACAVSHSFDLTNEEFAEILVQDDKRTADILAHLARHASELRLCISQAVHDVLTETEWDTDADPHGSLWETAADAADCLAERLARLPANRREREAHEWRLYQLAVQAAPWKEGEKGCPPSDELGFLAGHVKEGDTWFTFIAFSKTWGENQWKIKRDGLDKLLQRRFPLTEEEWAAYSEEDPIDEQEGSVGDEEDANRSDGTDNGKAAEAHEAIAPDVESPLTLSIGKYRVWPFLNRVSVRVLYECHDNKGATLRVHDWRTVRRVPRVGDTCLFWRGQNKYTLRVDAVTWDFNIGAFDVTVSATITSIDEVQYNDIQADSRLYPIRTSILNALLFGGPLAIALLLVYLADLHFLRSLAWYIRLPVALLGVYVGWFAAFLFIGGPWDALFDRMIPRPPRKAAQKPDCP